MKGIMSAFYALPLFNPSLNDFPSFSASVLEDLPAFPVPYELSDPNASPLELTVRHINTAELITNFLCVITRKHSSTSGQFSTHSHPSLFYLLLLLQGLLTVD